MKKEKYYTFDDAQFKTQGLQSNKPVLVDFWAAWCCPCRSIAPVIESLAQNFKGEALVGKLNVDENPQTVAAYLKSSLSTRPAIPLIQYCFKSSFSVQSKFV